MKEEQFKVLKAMNEATSRMDMSLFAQKVNLNPNQAVQQVQELAREGFLQKVGNGYGISEKGRIAIKALTPVPAEMIFYFYAGVGKPLGFTAQTLGEFFKVVKQVYSDSLDFHLYRGDFEKWIGDVLKDHELAKAVGDIKARTLNGENLRKELLRVIDAKYNMQELL